MGTLRMGLYVPVQDLDQCLHLLRRGIGITEVQFDWLRNAGRMFCNTGAQHCAQQVARCFRFHEHPL